jgi:hypothetical protein
MGRDPSKLLAVIDANEAAIEKRLAFDLDRAGERPRPAVHRPRGRRRDRARQADRWIFSELARSSFRWRAVESNDAGRNWSLVQEMSASRTNA